jgi:hypothetical protein
MCSLSVKNFLGRGPASLLLCFINIYSLALSLNQIDALQENSKEGCGSGDVINDCCVFIGLYSNSSSNWRWTDGSSYDFNYWQDNQPPTAGNAIVYVGTSGQNFWSIVSGNCENALCEMNPLK